MSDIKYRLESRLVKDNVTECLNWTGGKNSSGYGAIGFNGKVIATHRVAYMVYKGEIPEGLLVRHTCDNRLCCNPNHLELGTIQDNMKDKVIRKRQSFGEAHPPSFLTEDQVLEILKMEGTHQYIANKFGVSRAHVSNIKSGRYWKHLSSTPSL
ncbi:putative HNH endonuclease [Aeromonas phage LAh_8]|uniref:Putative HNH endonuclease n=1 Tax=Aeromonas phage LAh_8 TaxID=2591032 RepID=A0A514A0G6_9CAUD|nr:endonuclease [Aeromonas phage LAh_8]QDH46778.1 putative HNH endonuclease [Aeromonas phage LAh_8]